ncbi:MAG: NAD/NADP octopine/nopaline dehydrogenase family protein [Burkholderiales bacterium]|nr:NAD/NADP octopine/nopaline dehydrogenase family protein [Burkholderiales bacterium]
MTTVAVLGAGPIGRMTAAFLASQGHAAAIWSPSGQGSAPLAARSNLRGRGVIEYTGALRGRAEVAVLDVAEAVADYEVIVVALPGHAYAGVLPAILEHVGADHVVIASGALSLLALWIHERAGAGTARPTVVSWGTTLGTARRVDDADVEINTLRSSFELAAIPAARGESALRLCESLFGARFRLVPNVLTTALSNINPVAHAAEALPNLTRMERAEHWFLFDCLTPAAARIAEAIDRERLAIARAYGLEVRSLEEHYHLSYHVPRGSVAEIAAAIHARDGAPPGPKTLEHRYLLEDMPYGLVFYEALARLAGVAVPVMSAAITFAGAAYARDFRCENSLLADLALDRLTPAALLARCGGARD